MKEGLEWFQVVSRIFDLYMVFVVYFDKFNLFMSSTILCCYLHISNKAVWIQCWEVFAKLSIWRGDNIAINFHLLISMIPVSENSIYRINRLNITWMLILKSFITSSRFGHVNLIITINLYIPFLISIVFNDNPRSVPEFNLGPIYVTRV